MVIDKELHDVIENIPQQNQRQYSTIDQLFTLIVVAHKLGLYDAADFIISSFKSCS